MIDRNKVYAYFNMYHHPVNPSTNGWYSCKCPICGKDKFAVNFDHLVGKCWRGCFNGFIINVIKMYHGIDTLEAHELIDSMETGFIQVPKAIGKINRNVRIQLPVGYHPILEGNTTLAIRARDYLLGRGFDLNYLDCIGVGYCNESAPEVKDNFFGYIIIPLKRDGILSYFIGRDYIGNFKRYKNPANEIAGMGKSELLFNEEGLFLNKKIYLTEGWACAATMGADGISVQGSMASTIQRNIIIKSPVEEVIIVPDADFYVQGLRTAHYLMKYKRVKVINLDWYKKNNIGKDINEIGRDNLINEESKTQWLDGKFLYHQLKVYSNKRISV